MYWSDELLNQEIYDLTRRAIRSDDDETVTRVLCRFEEIVQTSGYGLSIQKAFLLWESGRISADRLIIFLEDCYRWAGDLSPDKASALRDEVMRWAFHFLWRVTRPTR